MVYCSKCGYKNPDDAETCSQCQESLATGPRRKTRKPKGDDCFGPKHEMEDECFGLPHGGAIFAVLLGLVIIIVGVSFILQEYIGLDVDIWDTLWRFFIIIIGVLIVAGGIYGLRRR